MRYFLIGIFLLLLALPGIGQEDLRISKVRFKGNSAFPNSRLKDEISMEAGSWIKEKIFGKEPVYYSQELFDDDIKRLRNFYQKEGYLGVKFQAAQVRVTKKNKVEITFLIDEGKPILVSKLSFLVDSTYSLSEVLRFMEERSIQLQMQTSPDSRFRDESVLNDKRIIADAFYDKGYPYTQVEQKLSVDTLTRSTAVDWHINRGPQSYFGTTTVTGNSRVPTKSIMRQMAYKKGELWSQKKIETSQKQIYNQGNYRVASVRTQLESNMTDTVPMQIQITEAPRWTVRFGAGYGREDKFRAFTDVQYLSFITHTGRLNLYAKHSGLEPYNLYLKFSQPSFLFPFNTLVINPFMQREDEPGYKLDKRGYNITFVQNFSEELNTSIGFVYEDVEVDTSNVVTPKRSQDIESIYKKTGIVIGGIYNNADPILDPVQGYAISFNTKTNDIFFSGEMPFFRFLTEFKSYFGLQRGVVLGLKAKIGGIKRTDDDPFIPVEERFFAGGSHSVRGWSRSNLGPKDEFGVPVGGNSLLEGSLEFRFDVGRKMKFTLFTDCGNVWTNSFHYRLNDLHYAAGAGLKIKTPIGPAGIDFARPIFDSEDKWQFHFNIGHSF